MDKGQVMTAPALVEAPQNATPESVKALLAQLAAGRAEVPALEADSAAASAALASGPTDRAQAEALEGKVAGLAAEIQASRERTQGFLDRVAAAEARRAVLRGVK